MAGPYKGFMTTVHDHGAASVVPQFARAGSFLEGLAAQDFAQLGCALAPDARLRAERLGAGWFTVEQQAYEPASASRAESGTRATPRSIRVVDVFVGRPPVGRPEVVEPANRLYLRHDSGTEQGAGVFPAFGTLLAKLIVTGASRAEALQRARRALHEFEVTGLATGLPLHRTLVAHEAFAPPDPARPFSVHTSWVESNWSGSASPGA